MSSAPLAVEGWGGGFGDARQARRIACAASAAPDDSSRAHPRTATINMRLACCTLPWRACGVPRAAMHSLCVCRGASVSLCVTSQRYIRLVQRAIVSLCGTGERYIRFVGGSDRLAVLAWQHHIRYVSVGSGHLASCDRSARHSLCVGGERPSRFIYVKWDRSERFDVVSQRRTHRIGESTWVQHGWSNGGPTKGGPTVVQRWSNGGPTVVQR